MPVIDTAALIDNRVQAIKDYHTHCGIEKAQLDISGGIDSAVMAMLLVLAQGAQNCIFDHTIINTDPKQTGQAKDLCELLRVPLAIGNFSGIYSQIVRKVCESLIEAAPLGPWWGGPGLKAPSERLREEILARMADDPTIEGSIRSTLRAPLGRAYNRIMGGGIRHGTGNECEDRFLRFYQKGGDGEVDTNPLAMLSKTEVYQLAYALGHRLEIYDAVRPIIEAIPSPDLWGTGDAHSDEAEMLFWMGAPFTYGHIDPETGEITHIGTIERVSRFLDLNRAVDVTLDCRPQTEIPDSYLADVEGVVFGEHEWENDEGEFGLESPLIKAAEGYFKGFTPGEIKRFLSAARKAERQTRHKMNPNIPTLGVRRDLVCANILTDEFPSV